MVVDSAERTALACDSMTTLASEHLRAAVSHLHAAESGADIQLVGQHARTAIAQAVEAALEPTASEAERTHAKTVLDKALALATMPRPARLIEDARAALERARAHTNPVLRRQEARAATTAARTALRHPDADDNERAQARRALGESRMMTSTIVESAIAQGRRSRDREGASIEL